MGGVFINYRSTDNPLGAAGIHDALVSRFGAGKVFRDCVSIKTGGHYPTVIWEALENSDALVAIIGPQWLTLTDVDTGERLIDRDHDWVRRELAWAFQRRIYVLPVLLLDTPDHATQPTVADLPDDIKRLAVTQAFPFSQRTFRADVDRLATRLVQFVPALTETNKTGSARLSSSAFAELVSALEAVPCVLNDDTRTLLISQLRPTISGAIRHYPQRRAHVMGILNTCMNYEQGIADLIAAMRNIEQSGSLPMQRFIEATARLLPEAMHRA
jgi:hypothetical protein